MVKAGAAGLVWNEQNLADFLRSPREFVVGNRMTAAPMAGEQAIADLIAYLKASPEP
jgi:cytochrome c